MFGSCCFFAFKPFYVTLKTWKWLKFKVILILTRGAEKMVLHWLRRRFCYICCPGFGGAATFTLNILLLAPFSFRYGKVRAVINTTAATIRTFGRSPFILGFQGPLRGFDSPLHGRAEFCQLKTKLTFFRPLLDSQMSLSAGYFPVGAAYRVFDLRLCETAQ